MRRTFGAVFVLCLAVTGSILLCYSALIDTRPLQAVTGLSLSSRLCSGIPLQPRVSKSQPAAAVTSWPTPSRQERRLGRVRAACVNNTRRYIAQRYSEENLDNFLVDLKHRFVFCPIPKVSSSTMKRIFSVLANKNKGRSILNISSRFIHRHPEEYDNAQRVFKKETFVRKFHLINKAWKAMFVRDPYKQLFSAYIDRVFGVSELLMSLVRVISPKRNQTTKRINCSLSFTDVVRYMTSRGAAHVDQHFRPSYSHCFPCHIQYDFIGKVETWREDAEAMLTSIGADPKSVLGEESGFKEKNELSILRDIVKRVFEMIRSGLLQCFSRYELLKRTWISFKVRGFLPLEAQFPLSEHQAENVTLTQFDALVKDAYSKVKDRESVRRQKELAVREAFYSLPRPLLLKVQNWFQPDCELFGYECSVDIRFNETRRHKPVFHLDTL